MAMASERKIFQNAWVVPDVYEAAMKWVRFYGVGPFYVSKDLSISNVQYRGRPGELRMSVGLAQAGPVQIELIQQHSAGPSAYRDMWKEGQSGFHHVCVFSHDYDADMRAYPAAGYDAVTYGGGVDGVPRFAYFDARRDFDVFLEIVEPTETILASFEMARAAAEGWDGRDPIRIRRADGGYDVP
jgi:hypothetical protein